MVDTIHSFDVGDSKPFKSCPYRKSVVEEQVVAEELNSLLDAGLLKPSNSPWASTLLLIKKKNGGHCVVMDYGKLNISLKRALTFSLKLMILLRNLVDLSFFQL